MEDKYLWLEEVLDKKNLEWASNENDRTAKILNNGASFDSLVNEAAEILESKEKIPFATYIEDDFVYNLWKDDKNVQGLFRRTKISNYNKEITPWEILIDLDALSLKEGQKWVFHGCHTSPSKERALMFLSPGGSDADVMREFDLKTKNFFENGFELPLAKGKATWITENELIVIRDMGSETVTSSGYAKEVRLWNRGEATPNTKAIFEIPKEDMGIFFFEGDGENPVILLSQKIDFYSGKTFLYKKGKIEQIDLPHKYEEIDATDKTLYFSVKENWKEFHLGDVVAYNYEDRSYELVHRPSANSAVYSISIAKDGLFMIIDIDVKSSLFFFSKKGGAWSSEKIEMPANGSMDYLVSAKKSNDFFVGYDSFNMPLSYFYGVKNKIDKIVKKEKSFFNHEDIEVSQHFVKSLDGTQVPYFLVHKKGLKMNGTNPTILYGYGGFEISLKAHFSNILGKLWLDKGGVYVLSNIRGGGEYGPAWHQSALKENRDRAYQDFFAIAEDLVAKKITSNKHLGAAGGSNGGLLMGVCFTQRPELFRVINCGVPLLDMHRYHKLLAGHSWVAEYGNPDDEVDGRYIRNLSPYQRIVEDKKDYPVMYLNTSTKDDRVHPAHARKFAAKLKEYGIDYLYYENINGGHAGSSNLKELAFVKALDYAFFWKYLK